MSRPTDIKRGALIAEEISLTNLTDLFVENPELWESIWNASQDALQTERWAESVRDAQ